MSDVDIAVDSGDLKAAIALLNEYGMSFTNMVNKVQTESNKLARAAKATSAQVEEAFSRATQQVNNNKLEEAARKEAQILKQREQNWKQFFQQDFMKGSSTGINKNNSALVQHFKDIEDQMKQTAVAAKAEADQIAYLTKNYAPLLAAEQRYNQIKQEVQETARRGLITIQQETVALDQLEKEYKALGSGVYMAGSRFNQFGQMAQFGGKSAQKFGMYAQQAGYQIGDFAVQLQSGANAGVAFSQQAAQLAGLIPGLAGALTTFAAIGVGLFIQSMTRGEKKAQDFSNVVSDFEKFTPVFESAAKSLEGSFGVAITNVAAKYGTLVASIQSDRSKNAIDTLVQGLQSTTPRAGVFNPTGENSGFGSKALEGTKVIGGGILFGPSKYYENIAEANRANVAIDALRGKYEELRQQSNLTTSEMAKELERVSLAIIASTEYTEAQKKALTDQLAEMGWDQILVDIADAQEEQNKKADELLQKLNSEAEMRVLINTYGKDSLEVKQAELLAEHEKTKAMIEGLDVASDLKDELHSAADAAYSAESATLSWADAMAQVNRQLSGAIGLLNSIGGGMIQTAGIRAANEVLDAGGKAVDAEKARRRAEEDARLYQINDKLLAEGKTSIPVIQMEQAERDRQRQEEDALIDRLNSVRESEREANKKSRGGRKSGGRGGKSDAEKAADKAKRDAEKIQEKLQDFISDFELNIRQQERLSGVFGEQREEIEKVIEIENRLGDARGLVSEKQIQAWANEELALERKLQREQELYNIGNQNFENFLMTIVNGTASVEDAFRVMLANIISDIYQKFVAEGAANVAGNFLVSLFSAKGNAFGSGGVKFFAKGGVVNSPTGFKHSGGLGVMGEAGPEAIMPLKRNSQGRLGVEVSGKGSGNVEINQYFSMSANGDQAVKQIIQQEMPKIATASKQAVIEAKRRGEKGL